MTKGEPLTNDAVRSSADEAFWASSTSSVVQEGALGRVFDLEGRTARFGEAVIDFAKRIPRGPLTDRLIAQLVGCGTSVGANYCEADDAVSRKEFFLRAGTCRKESRETKHFVRMIVRAVPELTEAARGSGPAALVGSPGIESDFRHHLPEEREMRTPRKRRARFAIRHLVIPSGFGIRISGFLP